MTTSIYAKSATQSAIQTNGVESLIISDQGDLAAIKSLNSGSLGQLRNKHIGGHFDRNPWQRGTSFTVTATGTYVADRWRVDFDGTANITVSKVALPVAQLINGVWCAYGLKFLVNSKASNTYIRLSQRIEDVDTLTTLPATLQTAILGSGSFTIPVNARQSFGTGGAPSADVVTPFTSSLLVTSSLQQLNTGLTVPTISGKTLGSGLNDFLATEYDLMNVPAAGYVVIALSGLEPGNFATVWEDRRRIELSLCQRYVWKVIDYQVTFTRTDWNPNYAGAGTLPTPVPFRAIPAVSGLSVVWGGTVPGATGAPTAYGTATTQLYFASSPFNTASSAVCTLSCLASAEL